MSGTPNAVMMAQASGLSYWNKRREDELRDLALNRNDRSNIGSVDPGVLPLVQLLNGSPQFYTQSSCSGRTVVFHRVRSAEPDKAVAKKRGAGRGNVFSTHDPIPSCGEVAAEVWAALTQQRNEGEVNHDLTQGVVELKFEPVMLHVACRNASSARLLLDAAISAGLRASGVLSMPETRVNLLVSPPEPLLQHVSAALSQHRDVVDIIGTVDDPSKVTMRTHTVCLAAKFGFGSLMKINGEVLVASAAAIERMLHHANELFQENEQRKARFMDALRTRLDTEGPHSSEVAVGI